jgi:hypothetical protein
MKRNFQNLRNRILRIQFGPVQVTVSILIFLEIINTKRFPKNVNDPNV